MKIITSEGEVEIDILNQLGCEVRYHNTGMNGNARISLTHTTSRKRKYFWYDWGLPSVIHEQAAYHLAINDIRIDRAVAFPKFHVLIIPDEFHDKFNNFIYD